MTSCLGTMRFGAPTKSHTCTHAHGHTHTHTLHPQVAVEFTKLNGEKWLRVLTQEYRVETTRDKAEGSLQSTSVALCAIHQAARLAQTGAYQDARIHLVNAQRLLQRGMKTTQHQEDYMSVGVVVYACVCVCVCVCTVCVCGHSREREVDSLYIFQYICTSSVVSYT